MSRPVPIYSPVGICWIKKFKARSSSASCSRPFSERNQGYISGDSQAKIAETTLLIAGCGIGSATAICATRLGFQKFILIDGDVVGTNNLNRQAFDASDVGRLKVEALKDKILAINPQAEVEAIAQNLDDQNVTSVVARADIIFDTVDFLDLPAILALHLTAHHLKKPILTALSVGFGALVWYFPAGTSHSLPQILQNYMSKDQGLETQESYAIVFSRFVQELFPHLDTEVVHQIQKTLLLMQEGKPCPAPQVSPGAFGVAALATSLLHDIISGTPVPESPNMLLYSFRGHAVKNISL